MNGLPTKYYHHPESECTWFITDCNDVMHVEQMGADPMVEELSYDQYMYWKQKYKVTANEDKNN